jgi:hypothetical protein
MKKITLILIFFLSVSCSKSQDNQTKIWSTITYNFFSGPLPPQYQNKYSVVINEDKNGYFSYSIGIDSNENSTSKIFTVTDDNIAMITQLVNESGLLEGKIISLPEHKHPIGGSLRSISVVLKQTDPNLDQPPPVYIAPYFPVEEYKEKLEKLYDYIYMLVPQEFRDEYIKKRDG